MEALFSKSRNLDCLKRIILHKYYWRVRRMKGLLAFYESIFCCPSSAEFRSCFSLINKYKTYWLIHFGGHEKCYYCYHITSKFLHRLLPIMSHIIHQIAILSSKYFGLRCLISAEPWNNSSLLLDGYIPKNICQLKGHYLSFEFPPSFGSSCSSSSVKAVDSFWSTFLCF